LHRLQHPLLLLADHRHSRTRIDIGTPRPQLDPDKALDRRGQQQLIETGIKVIRDPQQELLAKASE
jgi:hypothetical protein